MNVFGNSFSHYLSYGSTDQQTVRDLTDRFDGLVVPGTVAAFQRDGTGGFVLTLSATQASPDYVIDPRFPLFQQALPQPKRSHQELANILGVPSLVQPIEPIADEFGQGRIDMIAQGWVDFNLSYQQTRANKFDKYAKRLNEEVFRGAAKPPRFILPPYACVSGTSDPWWNISTALFDASLARSAQVQCIRVVATKEVGALASCLADTPDRRLIIWVSGLDEFGRDPGPLVRYLQAIEAAAQQDRSVFALYGGFFAVLASSKGLTGASHGIGYGESRNWIELPQSGPPPARYYLPQVHRYVSQELAYQLWLEDRSLAECSCGECAGQPPIALEYHSLMKHSVLCRASEIAEWEGLTAGEMVERLDSERAEFVSRLQEADLADFTLAAASRNAAHLEVWREALEQA